MLRTNSPRQSSTPTSSRKKNGKAVASTGWETMLSAVISAGFQIVGTWPMLTERSALLGNAFTRIQRARFIRHTRLPTRGRTTHPPRRRRQFLNELDARAS